MSFYQVGNGIVASKANYGYIPGVYDTERTARYAFRFTDKELQDLQNSINPDGLITFEMLQDLRKRITNENNNQ